MDHNSLKMGNSFYLGFKLISVCIYLICMSTEREKGMNGMDEKKHSVVWW